MSDRVDDSSAESAKAPPQSGEHVGERDVLERLHAVASSLFGAEGPQPILEEILDAAISVSGADCGDLRVLGREGTLHVVAARGCSSAWLEFWSREPAPAAASNTGSAR